MYSTVTTDSAINYSHAAYYASCGYYVFPCHTLIRAGEKAVCTCRNREKCENPGKHPRTWHGVKDASRDQEKISEWWTKWPNANIAIATGKLSGIFVLDVDTRNGGEFSLECLKEQYREVLGGKYQSISETLISKTGGSGRHFIFRYPNRFPLKGGRGLLGRGLDVCSDGSYIIAPPSLHKSGHRYQWHGSGLDPAEPPDWLLYEIFTSSNSINLRNVCAIEGQSAPTKANSKIFEGNRELFLFKNACGLVHSFPPNEVMRRIVQLNTNRCSPPLDQDEINKAVRCAERYR